MSNEKISQMPVAIALDGTEYFPLVQSSVNKRATVAQVASLAVAGGRLVATGIFTLTPSATSTTVSAPLCNAGSYVGWSPNTADAAADMNSLSYVAGAGQFVLTHSSDAGSDRTFTYVLIPSLAS